jgi:hypothetical protein
MGGEEVMHFQCNDLVNEIAKSGAFVEGENVEMNTTTI